MGGDNSVGCLPIAYRSCAAINADQYYDTPYLLGDPSLAAGAFSTPERLNKWGACFFSPRHAAVWASDKKMKNTVTDHHPKRVSLVGAPSGSCCEEFVDRRRSQYMRKEKPPPPRCSHISFRSKVRYQLVWRQSSKEIDRFRPRKVFAGSDYPIVPMRCLTPTFYSFGLGWAVPLDNSLCTAR